MSAPVSFTEQWGKLYASTLTLRLPEIEDAIHNATPFYWLMEEKGRRKAQVGGRRIEKKILYKKGGTVTHIGKGSVITLKPGDVFTVAAWDWKYTTGHLISFAVDRQQNRGEVAVTNMVNDDIDALIKDIIDQKEIDLFSDGTADGGLQLVGLQKIVADNPTSGTYAQINRANYSWWRNQYKDMNGKSATLYLRKYMNNMFNSCGKLGKGVTRFPDILICSQDVYELYDEETFEITRIVVSGKYQKLADMGYGDLAFKGRPLVWSPECPSGHLYFLNTSDLTLVYDPDYTLKLGDWVQIPDQPGDYVAHVTTAESLICVNPAKQGVIFNISE